jgi:hypothetical protein
MQTIEKTVAIPENRRLTLELPADTPTGELHISLTITPVSNITSKQNIMDFWGIFKDHPAFSSDSVEIQRKMRDEW